MPSPRAHQLGAPPPALCRQQHSGTRRPHAWYCYRIPGSFNSHKPGHEATTCTAEHWRSAGCDLTAKAPWALFSDMKDSRSSMIRYGLQVRRGIVQSANHLGKHDKQSCSCWRQDTHTSAEGPLGRSASWQWRTRDARWECGVQWPHRSGSVLMLWNRKKASRLASISVVTCRRP